MLTHSSGGAVVLPLAVPLPLAAGLGSELGLVVTSAASAALVVLAVLVAVVLAVAVAVPVAVAVAVLVAVAVAVPVVVGVPDGDVEADCVGEAVRFGPPLTLTGGGNKLGGALAAAEWLAKAREAAAAGGLLGLWERRMDEIMTRHQRKYKLMPLLKALR